MVVGLLAGDAPAMEPDAVVALSQRLVHELDAATYPGLALQVEDHAATTRWRRGQRPRAPPRRVARRLDGVRRRR